MPQIDVDIVVGLDVGKHHHHAWAIDRHRRCLGSRRVANTEAAIRELLADLSRQGTVRVVVDQPATIGALAVAVAQDAGVDVAYLPGLTMRRMADTFPGEAKTDARDAEVIAVTALTRPDTLRHLPATADDGQASLRLLCGHRDDLTTQRTATINRLRGLLTERHVALERVLGPALEAKGVLELLIRFPDPVPLQRLGPTRLERFLRQHGSRKAGRLTTQIRTALATQTVTLPGAAAAAMVIAHLATTIQELDARIAAVDADIAALLAPHPLLPVLTSLPGVGLQTAAVIIAETGGRTFPSAAHLAAYAGCAPVTRQSGTSIRGERGARRGNRRLKQALWCAAFAALRADPDARARYDHTRQEGKHHTQALLALARHRIDILYAMCRDHTLYRPPTPLTPP